MPDDNDPRLLIARAGSGGPILDHTRIAGFRVYQGCTDGTLFYMTNPDGSKTWWSTLTVSRPLTGVQAQISIYVAGVTFDDGTTSQTLDPGDFDSNDEYRVTFEQSGSVSGSVCHETLR